MTQVQLHILVMVAKMMGGGMKVKGVQTLMISDLPIEKPEFDSGKSQT